VSAVLFRNACRPVQHLKDCLACFVELIGAARPRSRFRPRKRNHLRLGIIATDLTVHRSHSFSTFSTQIVVRVVVIVARQAFCTSSKVSMGD
jgi:hypothetical protein